MITWNKIMGDIRTLLTEYYQESTPVWMEEEVSTVDDADVIAENIAEYVKNMEAREVLEEVFDLKLYLKD